jgi:hypothetical protein
MDSRNGQRKPDIEIKEIKQDSGWIEEHDRMISEWSDIAMCYRWLHDRSERRYSFLEHFMAIPVIILSTLTGTANFGIQSFIGSNNEYQKYANAVVGGVSILAGILATLNNFFKFAQLSESHRIASIGWSKFHRQLSTEVAIHPSSRMEFQDFLKICRVNLDRLIEQSPGIPRSILKDFENHFGKIRDIKKPDICNDLQHTPIFSDTEQHMRQLASDASLTLYNRPQIIDILTEKEKMLIDIVKRRTHKALEKCDGDNRNVNIVIDDMINEKDNGKGEGKL